MKIPSFATEHFFARYEFTAPHLLSVSDCETVSVGQLLELAGQGPEVLLDLRLGYTETAGSPALREAVAGDTRRGQADQVLILATPVEGLFVSFHALLGPEDEAVVLMPAYDALRHLPGHVGARVRPWYLKPTDTGWRLDLEELDTLLGPRTRLVVVNFPHNPTGFLPTQDCFEQLVRRVEKHGAVLFSDEMYRGLERDPTRRLPTATDLSDRALVLSGLSKAHGLPGLRCGWLLIPDAETRAQVLEWKHYTSICPPAPSERLALVAWRAREELVDRNRRLIADNLVPADEFFARRSDVFRWRPPTAGSVALVELLHTPSERLCLELANRHGVVLLPGEFLGAERPAVRFGFGRKSFPEALQQLDRVLDDALQHVAQDS